jgi:hypothetical protein
VRGGEGRTFWLNFWLWLFGGASKSSSSSVTSSSLEKGFASVKVFGSGDFGTFDGKFRLYSNVRDMLELRGKITHLEVSMDFELVFCFFSA